MKTGRRSVRQGVGVCETGRQDVDRASECETGRRSVRQGVRM